VKTVFFVALWTYAAGIVGTWIPLMFAYWDSANLEKLVIRVTEQSLIWPVTISNLLS